MKIGIAGAGAGKTTAMANTIIQFRSEIEAHKKIFCITRGERSDLYVSMYAGKKSRDIFPQID